MPHDIPALSAIDSYSEYAIWSQKDFEAEIYGPVGSYSHIKTAHVNCVDSSPVGFICFRLVFEELYIIKISVRPESRRMGIGSALVLESFRAAAEKGASQAVLDVDKANTPALRLYEKLGFRPAEPLTARRCGTINMVRSI